MRGSCQLGMSKAAQTDDRGRLLTPAKAAETYGLERSQIYWWVRNRRFAIVKLERSVLFWEKDFVAFLDQNAIPASEE